MTHFSSYKNIQLSNYPADTQTDLSQPPSLLQPRLCQTCSRESWDFAAFLNHFRLSFLLLIARISSSPCWYRLLSVNSLVDSAKNHLTDVHPGKFATHINNRTLEDQRTLETTRMSGLQRLRGIYKQIRQNVGKILDHLFLLYHMPLKFYFRSMFYKVPSILEP